MTTSPTNRLRDAATAVRQLAAAVPRPPWSRGGIGDYGWTVHLGAPTDRDSAGIDTRMDNEHGKAITAWIALMNPAVGEALASWLEHVAAQHFPEDVTQIWPKGDDYQICGGCSPVDNERRWPCADVQHALATAEAILAAVPE